MCSIIRSRRLKENLHPDSDRWRTLLRPRGQTLRSKPVPWRLSTPSAAAVPAHSCNAASFESRVTFYLSPRAETGSQPPHWSTVHKWSNKLELNLQKSTIKCNGWLPFLIFGKTVGTHKKKEKKTSKAQLGNPQRPHWAGWPSTDCCKLGCVCFLDRSCQTNSWRRIWTESLQQSQIASTALSRDYEAERDREHSEALGYVGHVDMSYWTGRRRLNCNYQVSFNLLFLI